MLSRNAVPKTILGWTMIFSLIFLLSGCSALNIGGQSSEDQDVTHPQGDPTIANEPYSTPEFRDLLIPGELEYIRENSVLINTESFAGGILNFSGRVEVNSLTDFFINSMKKNDWEIKGTIKSKNILLSFIKPNGTCMIRIFSGDFARKTEVYVYITKVSGK